MADFSNIKKQALVAGTTREYTFDSLVGEPSVILTAAHDENIEFLDERLRLATERARKMTEEPKRKSSPAGEITPDLIKRNMAEDRDYDRRILASTCIKSWGTAPIDVNGKAVKFSPDEALSFLEALPDYLLDPFRSYAQNIFNFVERPKRDPKAEAALGEQ